MTRDKWQLSFFHMPWEGLNTTSTIGIDRLTHKVAGVVAGQKDNGAGDLFARGNIADRQAVHQLLMLLFVVDHPFHQFGQHWPWGAAIDPNTLVDQRQGHRFG